MQHIVVGIDGSPTSRAALRWALGEAGIHGASVTAVHAWLDPYTGGALPFAPGLIDPTSYRAVAERLLDAVVDDEAAAGSDPVRRLVVHDSAAHALVEAAVGADLLVVGSRGHGGFAGLLLGSVSQQVIHHAPCPVVVLPPVTES